MAVTTRVEQLLSMALPGQKLGVLEDLQEIANAQGITLEQAAEQAVEQIYTQLGLKMPPLVPELPTPKYFSEYMRHYANDLKKMASETARLATVLAFETDARFAIFDHLPVIIGLIREMANAPCENPEAGAACGCIACRAKHLNAAISDSVERVKEEFHL